MKKIIMLCGVAILTLLMSGYAIAEDEDAAGILLKGPAKFMPKTVKKLLPVESSPVIKAVPQTDPMKAASNYLRNTLHLTGYKLVGSNQELDSSGKAVSARNIYIIGSKVYMVDMSIDLGTNAVTIMDGKIIQSKGYNKDGLPQKQKIIDYDGIGEIMDLQVIDNTYIADPASPNPIKAASNYLRDTLHLTGYRLVGSSQELDPGGKIMSARNIYIIGSKVYMVDMSIDLGTNAVTIMDGKIIQSKGYNKDGLPQEQKMVTYSGTGEIMDLQIIDNTYIAKQDIQGIAVKGEMPAALVLQGSAGKLLPPGVSMAGTMITKKNEMESAKH